MAVLGLCFIYFGCEKKSDEPVMVEEDEIVIEKVAPPAAPEAGKKKAE